MAENTKEPEVRVYKRGNDDINLDEYISKLDSGFNDWLAKTKIKSKYHLLVRDAYLDLITKLNQNPESMTYNFEGKNRGFDNTFGRINVGKGLDPYGIVAGYFGDTLRGMSVYSKPEVKSDKTKYTRDTKLITPEYQSSIWGDNPDSFIMLDNDSFDATTNTRSLTHRFEELIKGLTSRRDSLKTDWDFENDDDYNYALGLFNSTIDILKNDNPNDDWFALERLGFTNPESYLSTGKEPRVTPLTAEELVSITSLQRLLNFENWMNSNHPLYTGNLLNLSIDSNVGSATSSLINELYLKIRGLSLQNLNNLILYYLKNPKYTYLELLNSREFVNGATGNYLQIFSPSLVIKGLLAAGILNGQTLKRIDETNCYYLPGTISKGSDGKSSSVWVYDTDSQSLLLVDTHKIKDYRDKYINEYSTSNSIPTVNSPWQTYYGLGYGIYKEGGIIKAQSGANTNNFISGITHVDGFKWYDSVFSLYIDDLFEEFEKRSADGTLDDYVNLINKGLSDHQKLYYNWKDTTKAYKGTSDYDVKGYQQGIIDNFGFVNTKGIKNASNSYVTSKHPNTTDRADSWTPDNYFSAKTDDRRILGRVGDFSDELLNELKAKFAKYGYSIVSADDTIGTYYYLSKTGNNKKEDLSQILNEYNSSEEKEKRIEQAAKDSFEPYAPKGSIPKGTEFHLGETPVETKDPKKFDWSKLEGHLRTSAVDALELTGYLLNNKDINKATKIVDKSLVAPLEEITNETPEQVRGRFSVKSLYDSLAAAKNRTGSNADTSDASLMAAKLLEAENQANTLRLQGNLIDDEEIKRTRERALELTRLYQRNRTDVANRNMASIIRTNQAKAQLKADAIKAKGAGRKNLIDSYVTRGRQQAERIKLLDLKTQSDANVLWKNDQMQLIKDKYYAWRGDDTTKTFSDWQIKNLKSYSEAVADIDRIYNAKQNRTYRNIYGTYSTPSEGDLTFDINKYTWLKKGGTLINKIIRKK